MVKYPRGPAMGKRSQLEQLGWYPSLYWIQYSLGARIINLRLMSDIGLQVSETCMSSKGIIAEKTLIVTAAMNIIWQQYVACKVQPIQWSSQQKQSSSYDSRIIHLWERLCSGDLQGTRSLCLRTWTYCIPSQWRGAERTEVQQPVVLPLGYRS